MKIDFEKCIKSCVDQAMKEYELTIGMTLKEAVEKQIPKKPRKTDQYRGIFRRIYAYACPTCGNQCLEKYMNERQYTSFCWDCGQRIDWSDQDGLE